MEQPHSGEDHDHIVFVCSLDDVVVADGSAGLGNILDTGSSCALDVVTEWEESVGTACESVLCGDPCLLLFICKDFRFLPEPLLPFTFTKYIVIVRRHVDVDGIVAVRTVYALHEFEPHDLRVLSQQPVVRFLSCEAGAVDAALLTGSDAYRLAVLYVTCLPLTRLKVMSPKLPTA